MSSHAPRGYYERLPDPLEPPGAESALTTPGATAFHHACALNQPECADALARVGFDEGRAAIAPSAQSPVQSYVSGISVDGSRLVSRNASRAIVSVAYIYYRSERDSVDICDKYHSPCSVPYSNPCPFS